MLERQASNPPQIALTLFAEGYIQAPNAAEIKEK